MPKLFGSSCLHGDLVRARRGPVNRDFDSKDSTQTRGMFGSGPSRVLRSALGQYSLYTIGRKRPTGRPV